MPAFYIDIGVVVVRKQLTSPWADHVVLPYAVLPAIPAATPGTSLGRQDGEEYIYAGPAELVLHSSDTAHYRDNLATGRPSLWVLLRQQDDEYQVCSVTADPYEGEALTEGVGATLEAVVMPAEIEARLRAFIDAFHVERPFIKRQRDSARKTGRQEVRR